MKHPAIAMESLRPVLEELTREIKPILEEAKRTDQDKAAHNLIHGTLLHLVNQIFSYLPPEEQSHILNTCGTWFDVGLLVGRSPEKLADILDKANPSVEDIELPDWMWPTLEWSQD